MTNCRSVMQIDSFMWFWLPLNHKEAFLSCQVLQWLPIDPNWMNQICQGWECITKRVLAETDPKNCLGGQCSNCFLILDNIFPCEQWHLKNKTFESWGSLRFKQAFYELLEKNYFFLHRKSMDRLWIVNILLNPFERTKLPYVYI